MQEHPLPRADVTPAPISGPEAVSSAERRVLSPKQSWEGSQGPEKSELQEYPPVPEPCLNGVGSECLVFVVVLL